MSSSRLLAGLDRAEQLADEYAAILAERSEALEEARGGAEAMRAVDGAYCRVLRMRAVASRYRDALSGACSRLAGVPSTEEALMERAVAGEQAGLAAARAARPRVRGTPAYVAFRLRAWDVRNADRAMPPPSDSESGDEAESPEGGDVAVAASSVPGLVCPVTRGRMADPVRARRCGHVFSRRGAESVLHGVREAACPVAGCAGRFAAADLSRADDVAARIARASVPRLFD